MALVEGRVLALTQRRVAGAFLQVVGPGCIHIQVFGGPGVVADPCLPLGCEFVAHHDGRRHLRVWVPLENGLFAENLAQFQMTGSVV